MYSVLNTLSEYIPLHIKKKLLHILFLLVLKIVESLRCILKQKRDYSVLHVRHKSFQETSLTEYIGLYVHLKTQKKVW